MESVGSATGLPGSMKEGVPGLLADAGAAAAAGDAPGDGRATADGTLLTGRGGFGGVPAAAACACACACAGATRGLATGLLNGPIAAGCMIVVVALAGVEPGFAAAAAGDTTLPNTGEAVAPAAAAVVAATTGEGTGGVSGPGSGLALLAGLCRVRMTFGRSRISPGTGDAAAAVAAAGLRAAVVEKSLSASLVRSIEASESRPPAAMTGDRGVPGPARLATRTPPSRANAGVGAAATAAGCRAPRNPLDGGLLLASSTQCGQWLQCAGPPAPTVTGEASSAAHDPLRERAAGKS